MSFESEILDDAPLLFLRMGETTGTTAVDASANNRNGTYVGCVRDIHVIGPLANKGVRMRGNAATDYVNIPHDAGLSVTGNFAVACAFKTDVAQTSKRLVAKYAGGNTSFMLAFSGGNAGRLRWVLVFDTGNYEIFSPTSYADGQPHFVVGVRDGTQLRLYVDKVLVATGECPATGLKTNTAALTIGTNDGSFDDRYEGDIDEVLIVPSAPSAARIGEWYDELLQSTRLGGTATLDTGDAASAVLIRDWTSGAHLLTLVPAADGTWSTAIAAGTYEVTIRGPAGYQPVTHGPLSPV